MTFLKRLWWIEHRNNWKKNLLFIEVRCVCGKEYYMRKDQFRYARSCWCVTLNESKKVIIIWKKYNSIIPIQETNQYISKSWKTKRRRFLCRCDECWRKFKVLVDRIWTIKNCWCKVNLSHWFCNDSEKIIFYHKYAKIKSRCNNQNDVAYMNYWWRWIKNEWGTFEDFRDDMFESYLVHKSKNSYTSIDRIDNDWNYCKENCRWATTKEQSRNKRNTIMYKWTPIIEYCENNWLNYRRVYKRIKELWWSAEDAVTKPHVRKPWVIRR